MKKLILIFIGLITLSVVTPISAQPLDGEQVFKYQTKSEKKLFDDKVYEITRRYFGLSGGQGGMDAITRKNVDFVILEGNEIIPVVIRKGKVFQKDRHAMKLNERQIEALTDQNNLIYRGEVFENLHFFDKSENELNPQVSNRHQSVSTYTNLPDNSAFLRKSGEVFKPGEKTRSFDRSRKWTILPGPDGILLAQKRRLEADNSLQDMPPAKARDILAGYDELIHRFANYNVPSMNDCAVFEKKLKDDYRITSNDVRVIPKGYYAAIPLSKKSTRNKVTSWNDFSAMRIIIISHEEYPVTDCDDCDDDAKEKPAAEEEKPDVNRPPAKEVEPEEVIVTESAPEKESKEGDVITKNVYNYYGDPSDSLNPKKDTVAKRDLKVFLMGTYGKTVYDDASRDVYGIHFGIYPFPQKWGFMRRIGFGVGYENGGYFSSREVSHDLGDDGYYGKSYNERDNAHFDGFYGSLHFVVSNDAPRELLSLYGSVGYRWYEADEFSVGRTFNSHDVEVQYESTLIAPLTKEMLTFGFGIHLKPVRWLVLGADVKFGKSDGWDYKIPDMPAQYSGADPHSMLKYAGLKAGFCF